MPAIPANRAFPAASNSPGRASDAQRIQSLSGRVFGPTRLRAAEDDAALDARIDTCAIGRLTLVTIGYNQAVDIEPLQGKDEFVIQTLLAGRCRVHAPHGTVEMPPGATFVFSPTVPASLSLDRDCERFSVVIRRQLIEEAFRLQFGFDPPTPIEFDMQPVADDGRAERWQALVAYLRAETRVRREGTGAPAMDASIERIVLSTLLLDRFAADGGMLPSRIAPALPGYVRCAIAYLRTHLDHPLTLEQVAAHCGVSARTLQLGFRKSKNTTPMEYLRLLRLQAARADLQRIPQEKGMVSAIALRHGFTHLSLFSREYRKAFGELPSDTLQAPRG
ncbi:helix-turn-helix transcriptional regulator [Cupriavidus pinatubonensis]|uniref:HTH-type transcriptional activator RhaS n=1 Tax=Cupriavidus pinatubonensis TaxID=248026 RepID=A0ABN7YBZ5_9BURK|nr:AraC family transcriptional regulator [Cupriavidus pinatubonensis]CAG9170964.1 HTH-type transcriptional activator RhaS [Cupriavidus pinatubonensis]